MNSGRDLAAYYAAYRALTDHLRACLAPERSVELRYEDVVADVESQARRLVAACGLPWNDACLKFHESPRPVRTASVNKVRQPIYRTSVAKWQPYERHLRPLIDGLG